MITTIEQNLYRDNSRVTPADVDANPNARRANSKREPTFPMKLHALLSDPEAEGVIVWLPHGRSWKIINQDKFESTLLGKHYEHGNMASFMRQVNGWNFRRVVKGVDENSYYHELFLRGMPHLCRMMIRNKNSNKRQGAAAAAAASAAPAIRSPKALSITPDFYRISREHPLPLTNMPDNINSSSSVQHQLRASAEQVASGDISAAQLMELQQTLQQRNATDIAAQALQNYILSDPSASAGARNPSLSNLQIFQQRLQERSALVNTLRDVVNNQQGGASSEAGAAGLLNNPPSLANLLAQRSTTGNSNLNNLGSSASLATLLNGSNPNLSNLLSPSASAPRDSQPNVVSNTSLTNLLLQRNSRPNASILTGGNPSLSNLLAQVSGSGASNPNIVLNSNPSLANLLGGQQQNSSSNLLATLLLQQAARNDSNTGAGSVSSPSSNHNATW